MLEGGVVIRNEENPRLNGIYQEIAEELGVGIAEAIYEKYGGLQIVFPNKFEDPESIHQLIFNEYSNGANVQRLAKKYKFSERYVRKILKKFQ